MKNISTTRQTIRLFWQHIMRYKRWFIPLVICVPIAVVLMDFIVPYIMCLVLQKISSASYNTANLWGSFGPYVVAYVVATFFSAIAGLRLNIWLVWNLELKVTRDLAQRVFDHLIDMSAGFHNNRFAGSLVSQANKLTGAYVRLFDATLFNLYTLV